MNHLEKNAKYQKQVTSTKQAQPHWSDRYSSHLLYAQASNTKISIEQREAARNRAKLMRYKFKFALVTYLNRFQSNTEDNLLNNPTKLKDDALRIINKILLTKQPHSYVDSANLFIEQSQKQNYKQFKQNLQKYLIKYVDSRETIDTLKLNLSKRLKFLYEDWHEEKLSDALFLETCRRAIHYLTFEDYGEPSTIFVLLTHQGHPLTLAMLLLKIILVCKDAYSHLENCIANLICYYRDYPEEECSQIINFLEVFDVIFTMHANDILYAS